MPQISATDAGPGVSGNNLEYVQVRIQARLSRWPAERDWAALAPLDDFSFYLEGARKTPMVSWLQGVRPDQEMHALEAALRQRMLEEVDKVAGWCPEGLQSAVRWYRFLPYLPFLAYLDRGEPVQTWMRKDPFLLGLLTAEGDLARERLSREGAELLIGEAAQTSIATRWLAGLGVRMPGWGGAHARGRTRDWWNCCGSWSRCIPERSMPMGAASPPRFTNVWFASSI